MSLGAYGDGGSMRGSGIYAEDWSGTFYCSDCEDEYSLDGQTDDYGYYASAECPDCGKTLEVELPSSDERDEDADYDAWRDSQLD
jgi:transcription elongation factor Elf1